MMGSNLTPKTPHPITGEKVGYFSATKRLQRQLLQVPFALIAAALLGCLIAVCFGIEVFVSEVYDGPLKSVLVCLQSKIALLSLRTN